MTDRPLLTAQAEFLAGFPSAEYKARMSLARDLTIKARNLDSAWGPQSSNPVKLRGDRLSRILWQGRQWAATKHGVECRDARILEWLRSGRRRPARRKHELERYRE